MLSYSVKLHANTNRVQKDGSAALYLQIIINGQLKFLPLDLKWPVDFFDKKAGQLLQRQKKDPDFNDYMLIIGNELQKINEIFKIYRIQDKPLNMESFLFEYNNSDVRKDFIVFMRHHLKMRLMYKQIDERTHKNGTGTVNRLVEFCKTLPFYMLTDKFLIKFEHWLRTKKGNGDGMVWSRMKDIRTYLNIADNEDLPVQKSVRKYKIKRSSSSLIYLESDEIDLLVKKFNAKNLSDLHQHVLAAFLFGCFTGLRISDLQKANWGWMAVGKVLKFVPHKNRKANRELIVPVGKIAQGFICNQRGYFFTLPTEQEMNLVIKAIAKDLKITTPITFHVARHTFGTHYYRQTKDVVTLQKLLGHAQLLTTMVYVHVNERDKESGIETMNDHFQQNAIFMRVVS